MLCVIRREVKGLFAKQWFKKKAFVWKYSEMTYVWVFYTEKKNYVQPTQKVLIQHNWTLK